MKDNYYYEHRAELWQMYEDFKRGGKEYDLLVLMDQYDAIHGKVENVDEQRKEFLNWAQSRPQGILE